MLFITDTPNNTGVSIHGDHMDLDSLYASLTEVIGGEGENIEFESARIRVRAICYDIRHSLMGDREIEYVNNGMNKDIMKKLSMITGDKNTYFVIKVLWPEILFVTMALNDFLKLYARKKSKVRYNEMLDYHIIWDEHIAKVRVFQSEIAKCLKEILSEASFKRIIHLMVKDTLWFDDYITQYLDLLNIQFVDMSEDKRKKSISTMAKKLSEQGEEYIQVKNEVVQAAEQHKCSIEDITLSIEYPEDIEW